MNVRCWGLWAALLVAGPALAEKRLTLLFTGDNFGEIAPCGCKSGPTGGLARRKTLVEQMKTKGPVLVLDAGNALFRSPGYEDAGSKQKAELILSAMGLNETAAMAAGWRDLSAGVEFLKETAKRSKVPVLSANLTEQGKAIFPASLVVAAGGLKVGLIGLSPPGPVAGLTGVEGLPTVAPALAEAKKLKGKVDLTVVLAAVPYADALQLSRELGGQVDLILHSHDGRGTGTAQRNEGNFLLPTGERGRHVGLLELNLDGKGPLVDLSELERQKQTLAYLDQQVAEVKARLAKVKDEPARKSLREALKSFEERRKSAGPADKAPTSRTLSLKFQALGADVQDDPTLRAQVEKLEAPP